MRHLLPPPLEKGGRRALARRVGISSRAVHLIPTRLARPTAGLEDLPFSRGGGACGTSYAMTFPLTEWIALQSRRPTRFAETRNADVRPAHHFGGRIRPFQPIQRPAAVPHCPGPHPGA